MLRRRSTTTPTTLQMSGPRPSASPEHPPDAVEIDARRGWRMVLRRTAALLAGETVARAFGFVVVLVLARRLEPSAFGLVTLGLTLAGWFAVVVDSGTELLNIREIARYPSRFRDIAERTLGLRVVLSLLAAAIFVAGVELFARSAYTRNTVVLFAVLLPAIALNLRWMALGVGGSRGVAVGNAASRMVVLIGVVVFVAGPVDVDRVPFLEATGELAYALIVLLYVGSRVWGRGFGWMRPRVDTAAWKATLRQSLPLMVNTFAKAAIFSFDVIVISLALGPHDVGIWGVAIRPTTFVAGAIGLFSLSFLSAFSVTTGDEAVVLHGKAVRVSMSACVAAAVALSIGSLLVPFVFGEAYRNAVPVLAVIAWGIPLVALGNMYQAVLISHGRQTTLMRNNLVVACAVCVIDLIAIPTLGLMGAAGASIIAAALVLTANHRSVARLHPSLRVVDAFRRTPGERS
jgi:O-antigen/teichoic acid export membrane protein